MKILIVCDMFPPAFAPRMGYLCKYLRRAGWEPVVITERIPENMFAFLSEGIAVEYVDYYHASGRMAKRLEWICVMILDFLFGYKTKKMYRVAQTIVKEGGFSGVLCSTYRTFPLPVAHRIAQKYHLPFVVDLRDIVEQYAGDEYIAHSFRTFPWLDRQIVRLFRRKLLKERNKALRTADAITTVSPWHVAFLKAYNPSVHLIYNGYDPELFYPENVKTSEFRVTYTGRLVNLNIRNPRLLLEAVKILSENGEIHPEQFRIQWYVDETSRQMLQPLIDSFGISDYMDFFNYIPAEEIPSVLNRSSVLLQLANKPEEGAPSGFMTTKLFEAFAVEKPLLLVRSDESFLEETIRNAHAGVAARTVDDVVTFLRYQYSEWKAHGFTSIDVNKEVTESFSRKKQAEQFMSLFTEFNLK